MFWPAQRLLWEDLPLRLAVSHRRLFEFWTGLHHCSLMFLLCRLCSRRETDCNIMRITFTCAICVHVGVWSAEPWSMSLLKVGKMMEEPLSPTSALICRRRISIAHHYAFAVALLPSLGGVVFMEFSALSERQRSQIAEVTPYTITASLRPWPSCTKPIWTGDHPVWLWSFDVQRC